MTTTIAREVSKIICDILQEEMSLDSSHLLLGNQKWDIPADKQLFVVVFDQASEPIGAANYLETDDTSENFGKEIQQSNIIHDARIEIMSFNSEARTRKEEIGLALASMFALQQAEAARIQIGRAQPAVDASDTEVAGRLLRYVIHVKITALHQKVKEPPKYDYFNEYNGAVVPGTANPPEVNING